MVAELRKQGSLRGLAKATGLGLRTVRTIVGRQDGTDRTTGGPMSCVDAGWIRPAWPLGGGASEAARHCTSLI
jgi:hypothetical protein